MRLLLSLGYLVALSTPALADTDPVACHVTITESTKRLDHHVTSCHSNDDTKYDEKLETSFSVRAGCKISMDDTGVTIDLDVPEPAVGSMQTKQENQGVYGSNASGTTTLTGKSSGSILLMKQPSGLLLPQGGLTFAAKSSGKEHIHDNCDPHKADYDHSGNSELDAVVTPFPEVFMHQKDPAAFMTAPPVFKISREAFEKGFASHRPFTVTGAGVYDWHDDSANADVHTDVSMTVDVGSVGYEAILEPVDDAGYDKWLPVGPDPGSVGKTPRGNSIMFKAYLRDKKTKKPSTSQSYTVRFKLAEVTNMPGVAMNFPRKADRERDNDLFFAKDMNHDGSVTNNDSEIAFPKGSGERTVIVTSRDYGAFGRLQAEIEVDGTKLLASVTHAGKQTTEASIPLDTNGNHVADAWEKDRGVFDQGLAGDSDLDATPSGMAKKGDGYTLYEEYRGFAVDDDGKLRYTRLDPKQRELFVIARGDRLHDHRPLVLKGVRQFGAVTGIRIYMLTPDLVEQQPELQYRGKYSSWTNFNALTDDKKHFGPAAAALWVVEDETRDFGPAYTPGINTAWDGEYNSPRDIEAVYVSLKGSRDLVNSVKWKVPPKTAEDKMSKSTRTAFWKLNHEGVKVEPSDIAPAIDRQIDDLAEQVFMFCVLHEMGHGLGAKHHGDELLAKIHDEIFKMKRAMTDEELAKEATKQQLAELKQLEDEGTEQQWGSGEETCPMRYWQLPINRVDMFRLVLGKFHPLTSSPEGKSWHFCDDNWSSMRLNGQGDERKNAHPGS